MESRTQENPQEKVVANTVHKPWGAGMTMCIGKLDIDILSPQADI